MKTEVDDNDYNGVNEWRDQGYQVGDLNSNLK